MRSSALPRPRLSAALLAGGGSLPATGAPALVPLAATAALGVGVLARRRRAAG